MSDEIKIVRPDAPRDVVSQQGPSVKPTRPPSRFDMSKTPSLPRHRVKLASEQGDVGLLNWLIAHCEFAAGGGYGPDGVAHLWLERAEKLRGIVRRKYGVEPIDIDRSTLHSVRPLPAEDRGDLRFL